MSLRLNVHRLTNDQRGMDGAITDPSLLSELRDAVEPSSADGAAGTGKVAVPINVGALDLYMDITAQAGVDIWEWKGFRVAGTPEDTIRTFAHADIDGEWGAYFERVTLEWIDRIEACLRPPKRYKLSVACPSCGRRFHGPERRPCLTVGFLDAHGDVLHPSEWDAECAACDAGWAGDRMRWLAEIIKMEGGLPMTG